MSATLELLGDRWSLLIVRDVMVRGLRTFKEFQGSGESIATNILADRLRRLVAARILVAERAAGDRRRREYRLTEKGMDLAPVLLEIFLWGARHEPTRAAREIMTTMAKHRAAFLAEVRRRWRERDPETLQKGGRWQLPIKP